MSRRTLALIMAVMMISLVMIVPGYTYDFDVISPSDDHVSLSAGIGVDLTIESAPHARMYYECVYDGRLVTEEVQWTVNCNGTDLKGTVETVGGIIDMRKLPYGEYVLKTTWKGEQVDVRITVDGEYVLTQDVLKTIDLGKGDGGSSSEPDGGGQPGPEDPDGKPGNGDSGGDDDYWEDVPVVITPQVPEPPEPGWIDRIIEAFTESQVDEGDGGADITGDNQGDGDDPGRRLPDIKTPLGAGMHTYEGSRRIHTCIWFWIAMFLLLVDVFCIVYRLMRKADKGNCEKKKEEEGKKNTECGESQGADV